MLTKLLLLLIKYHDSTLYVENICFFVLQVVKEEKAIQTYYLVLISPGFFAFQGEDLRDEDDDDEEDEEYDDEYDDDYEGSSKKRKKPSHGGFIIDEAGLFVMK